MLDYPKSKWRNNYLIYLKGNVIDWDKKLSSMELNYSKFYEPDLGDKLTAIAIESDGKIFRNLKLVK